MDLGKLQAQEKNYLSTSERSHWQKMLDPTGPLKTVQVLLPIISYGHLPMPMVWISMVKLSLESTTANNLSGRYGLN